MVPEELHVDPVTEVRGIPMAVPTSDYEGYSPKISGTAWGQDMALDGGADAASQADWDNHFGW